VASITILLSLYAATLARQQEIAIIRSLGANRGTVFVMTLLEAIVLALAGVICGLLLGHAIAAALGHLIMLHSAIVVETRILWQQELLLLLLPMLLGTVSGLLPAIMAYRVNVIEKLFPQ
jgi:putative ABC transport system permease protein